MLRKLLGNSLDHLMAFSLLVMGILIFINVVLRYVFNSGLAWSGELARFLFVWIIFLGAIGALKDNQHLGIDSLISRLPSPLKRLFLIIGQLLMLTALMITLYGSWKLTLINYSTKAPATGLSLSSLYGIGIVFSIGMVVIILITIFKLLRKAGYDLAASNQQETSEIADEGMSDKEGANKWL